jgi:AcrR family transcriptional regulator
VSRRSRDDALPPIWARPEPSGRGPRAALSRRQIVDAALLIADEEGLDAVSMRRLGRELRSGAMSIYHYFQSRDELLDLMGDTVAAEMLVDELPSDWREALRAIAHRGRNAFKRHPWLLPTLQDRPGVSPNLMRHVEQSAQAVRALGDRGIEPALLTGVVLAVDDYMIGYTLRELAAGDEDERVGGISHRFREQSEEPHVRYLLDSGEFPMLVRFLALDGEPPAHGFDDGLNWLLDGFAARHGL